MNAVDELETATRSSAPAARALEALAAELPHFEGRAMNLGGPSGGGGVSEGRDRALQLRRGLAVAAMRGCAELYFAGHRQELLALWLAHVHQGGEGRERCAKRPGAWFEELGYMLLPLEAIGPAVRAASRKGAGPDAAAARVRGAEVLRCAESMLERAMERAGEIGDSAWLVVLRASVDARVTAYRELVEHVTEERRAERKRAKVAAKVSARANWWAPRWASLLGAAPAEEIHPLTAVRIVETIGFAGPALQQRMFDALRAGDFDAVVEAAVDRGLADAFVELLAGVTDDDREAEREEHAA